MKKRINKKNAFTLVELMGLLLIIGILSTILIPVISNVLKENVDKIYQRQLQNIILASKNFGSDNMFLLPDLDGDSINITLGQLKKTGYLKESVINPKTKKEISNCARVEIKNIGNNYQYIVDESTFEIVGCDEDYDSNVYLLGPSKPYIRNGFTSSYILVIKPNDKNSVLSYSLDSDKITFGENIESKYSVIGENGIYKILVKAGSKEEELVLKFSKGAITDSNGNNVDTSSLTPNTIYVDNTAPTVTDDGVCPLDIYYKDTNTMFTKCNYFSFNDSISPTLKVYRSHCVDTNASENNPQKNACKTSNGSDTYSAAKRLEYYIKNGVKMNIDGVEDNKTTYNDYDNGHKQALGTTYGKQYDIQYAFRVCDLAGNCSNIQTFTK